MKSFWRLAFVFSFLAYLNPLGFAAERKQPESNSCSIFSETPGKCFRIPEFSSRRGDNWKDLDISFSKFKDVHLSQLKWTGVSGQDIDARGSAFFRSQFVNVSLSKSLMIGSNFTRSSFQGTSLIDSNLNGVKMSHVIFVGGSLKGTTLKSAIIKDSVFKNVEISRSEFKKAQCIQCDLRGVHWLP
jgi:uncharacterized protein YjbI with pentapeptide repeats